LGFLAGQTQRLMLHTMVTCAVYRPPALLAKQVSTLDVISQGRAALGIGAGWYSAEAAGLGIPFPSTAERFARLEETIEVSLRMWSASEEPFHGQYYTVERPLNAPQPLSQPRPKLIIGGAGERKTLRLVAKYADACNFLWDSNASHKLAVLREHCEREARDYDEIEKTTGILPIAQVDARWLLGELWAMHELGFDVLYVSIEGLPLEAIEVLGTTVIPEIGSWSG
jgi:alkanesulfonate monooxygenase SsuD/methylene tetrahydromethanopterin reductase-like flavin-dependent oxidoreductase (luciferase family)